MRFSPEHANVLVECRWRMLALETDPEPPAWNRWEVAAWLEADPPKRFSRLVDAALGRDAHLEYQRMRRLHAYEITEAGLVPIDDTGDSVALPLDAAG